MQSDTFLNNTDSDDEEYSSDSSGDLPENNNIGVKYDVPKDYSDMRFLDQSRQDKYLQLRNELFTKQIEHRRFFCKTHHLNMTIVYDGTNITIVHNDGGTIEISADSHAHALNCFGFTAGQTSVAGTITGTSNFTAHDFSDIDHNGGESLIVIIDEYTITINLDSNIKDINDATQILKYTLTTFMNEVDLDKYKLNNIKNLIGFELVRAHGINNNIHTHFVDIYIPEIPHRACKLNEHGIPIIDRVFLNNNTSNYFLNEPIRSEKNYFTPIKLSKFDITILDQNGKVIQPELVLEFEVTILMDSLSKR